MLLKSVPSKVNYIYEAKDKMSRYFTKFFGRKYSGEIKESLDNEFLICIDRKNTFVPLKRNLIKNAYTKLMAKFFNEALQNETNYSSYEKHFNEGIEDIDNLIPILEENDINNPLAKNILSKYYDKKLVQENYETLFLKIRELYINKYANKFNKIEETSKLVDENADIENIDSLLKNSFARKLKIENFPIEEFDQNIIEFLTDKSCLAKCCFKKDKNEKVYNMTIFDSFEFILNNVFVHELLHIISMKSLNKTGTVYKSGLGYVKGTSNTREKKINGDLDEICTEYFARKIVKFMNFNNFSPFSNECIGNYGVDFFEKFLDKHIDIFKEAYICDNPHLLDQKLGEKNVIALNDLVIKFNAVTKNMKYKKIDFDKAMTIALQGNYPDDKKDFYDCLLGLQNVERGINYHIKNNGEQPLF